MESAPKILDTMEDFIVVELPGRRGVRELYPDIRDRKPYGEICVSRQNIRVRECVERIATVFKSLKEGIPVKDSELLSKVMVQLHPEEFQDLAKHSKS